MNSKVFLILILFVVNSFSNTYDEAVKDLGAKRYISALKKFESLCKSDNSSSCEYAGVMYDRGLGTNKNIAKAKYFYKMACTKGDVRGCTNLGHLYGEEGKYEKAFLLFKTACHKGSKISCANVAKSFQFGRGVKKDTSKAIEIYTKLCNSDKKTTCVNLSLIYLDGLGVKKDYAKAYKYAKYACDSGDKDACGVMGYMYQTGKGVKQSYEAAAELYKISCDNGTKEACEAYKYCIKKVNKK